MIQLFHKFYLFYAIISLLYIVHVKDFQKLKSNELTVCEILSFENETKFTLANGLDNFVVSVDLAVEFTITNRLNIFFVFLWLFFH